MAKKTIKAQMKQRRDTKANWAATNPVLLDGELGIVSDDPNLYKVGDGATAWNDLPFRGFDGTLAQELGTSPNAVISQKIVSEKLTELESFVEKSCIVNVTEQYPLSEGYYTFETAILAIPRRLRKNGLIVQYAPNSYTWRYAQFYKVGVANFADDVWSSSFNWINIGVPHSPFFSNENVCLFPHLNAIKSVTIEALSAQAIVPEILSLTYFNSNDPDNSNTFIINFNHAISSSSKEQSLVLKAAPEGNILTFVKEQGMVRYTIVVDKSFWVYGINVQTNYNVWLDLVNYKFIPYSAKQENSIFFAQTNFTKKFGNNFLIDMSIRGGEPNQYIYYLYFIDVDREAEMPNVLVIERRNKNTGETETVLYLNADNYIDANGMMYYYGKATMTAASNITISILADWNIARLYAKGERVVYSYNQASFSNIVYRGGLGISENKEFKRLREIDVFPTGSYNLCKKRVSKLTDTPSLIGTSYSDEGEGTIQAVKNLSAYSIGDGKKYSEIIGKQYINLTNELRLLEITPDEKIWLANSATHNLHYFNNIDELLADTPHIVQIGKVLVNGQSPVAVKMNTKGELIVVAWNEDGGLGVASNIVRVYKSDSTFENWKLVLTYNTEYAGLSYPDWSVKAEGDRILLAGYGSHTTNYQNAIWDIYYSMDGGDTWYSHIFRLGEIVDIDGWTPTDRKQLMHIHGVAIDMYRHRLMVMNGDTEVSLFVTTNLAEWEQNVNRADSWNPSNTDALHWKRLSVKDSMKYTSGIALPDCLILGTDACPNGFQRINIADEYNNLNECAMSNPQIAIQRENADGTGDYAFYGYTLDRHSPSTPVICSLMYVGGVQPSDYKRNSVYVTDDGYTFSKIWEDDRDVVSYDGNKFTPLRPRTILTSRVNKNGDVLIQTCDSRFNDLVNGYPAPTSHHTLVIGKLNM